MRANIESTTVDRSSGETIASARIILPTEELAVRLSTPPAVKQEPLKLDEWRSMLEVERGKLAVLDEDLAAMKARQKEITYKIAAISRETLAAQDAVKFTAGEFARGRANSEAITNAQNALMLSQVKAPAFKDVLVEVNSELAKLQATRDDQAATVSRYSDSLWSLVESIELQIATPYIQRALAAAYQKKFVNHNLLSSFCNHVAGIASSARVYAAQHVPDLAAEYNIPPRA